MRTGVALILALTLLTAPARAGDILQSHLTFQSRERTYYLDAPAGQGPAPLLVLLHGSGGNGQFMAELWKDLAEREGVTLLAPNSLDTEKGWDLRDDGPDYIHALITAVAASHPIDFRRLYVFGQSGGAVYSLTLGMLESEYFAAIAFHGGGWRQPAEQRVLRYATRKIPVSIHVGDRDAYFPLKSVRHTQAVLQDAGFPVELNILEGRRHSLLDVPPGFNHTVWAFLKSHALDGPARYADYH